MKDTKNLRLTDLDGSVMVLKDVHVPRKFYDRILCGAQVVDEILGGSLNPGVVKGQTIILTGTPGAGKSTLAQQLADLYQVGGRQVLYNVGEESEKMVKMAAERIGLRAEFMVGKFEQVDDLLDYLRSSGIEIYVQDSLQSLRDGDLSGNKLLKTIAKKLHKFSKDEDVTGIIVGQVTKSGKFAGPQEIVHDFDAHAHLRVSAETGNRIFMMEKNRLGPAGMPYELFLSGNGIDLKMAPHLKGEDEQPKSRTADRRERIVSLIREKLLEGEKISGYCFDRFGVDVSGNLWRVLVIKACTQLKNEGRKVRETKIGGRTHSYLEG